MFAVTVVFQIRQDQLDAFLSLMTGNARTSLASEPGCRQFDVCTDPARPDDVFLYELYDDETAFKAHLESAHFKQFDNQTASMIVTKTIRTYAKVAQ